MTGFLKYSGKILKSIDIFGQKVEINFQKQSSYKTIFGGILTSLILFLFGLGCWFYGKELVEKQKPSVISSQRSVILPKRIDIKKENLIIAIGISDGQSLVYRDPTIFQLRAVQETLGYYNDISGKQIKKMIPKELKLKPCTIDDVGIPSLVDYFKELDLSQNYCFDENQEVYMEGDFDAERFSILYVYAEKCKNSTSEVICKSPEVIDKKLAKSKIKVSVSDNVVDPLNFKNPFTYKGISFASQTSSSSPKEVALSFVNQFIESDVGFMQEQIETIHSYIFSDIKESSFFNDPNVLVRLQLRVQKQRENLMQRRYQKFTDVVVQIGGLLKVLTTLGGLLCYPFTKLYLFKSVVDQVFQFDCNQDIPCATQKMPSQEDLSQNFNIQKREIGDMEKRKQLDSFSQKLDNESKQSKKELNQIKNNMEMFMEQSHCGNKLLEINQNQKLIKTEFSNQPVKIKDKLIEKTKGYFQSTHKIIKYSFFNIFSHIFFPRLKHIRQQRDLVEKGISKIAEHLDVFFILNKLLEIDKIKSILLNTEQLKLFEYIPKPVISIEKQFKESDQTQFNKSHNVDDSNNHFMEIRQKSSSYKDDVQQQTLNNAQQVYSLYQKVKSEQQKSIDACQGLTNILSQDKLSKIDESLINLIDPIIIKQFQKINNEGDFNKNDEISILNSYIDEKNNILRSSTFYEQQEGVLREKTKSFNNTNFVKRINEIKQQKRNYQTKGFSSRRSNNFDQKDDKIEEVDSQQISKNIDQLTQSQLKNEKSKLQKSLSAADIEKIIYTEKHEFTTEKQDIDKLSSSINEQSQYFVMPEHIQEQTNKIYLFQDMISQSQYNSPVPMQSQLAGSDKQNIVDDNQQKQKINAQDSSDNQNQQIQAFKE